MITRLVALSFLILGTLAYGADTVDQIVALAQKNVGEDALLSAVESSKAGFNLSAQDIIKLKQNNVPDKVITAMLQHRAADKPAVAPPAPARTEAPAAAVTGVLNIENLDDKTWSYRFEPEAKVVWIASAAADGQGNIEPHGGVSLRMPAGKFEVRYNGRENGQPVRVIADDKSLIMLSRVDTPELEALYVTIFERGERKAAGRLVTLREGRSKKRTEAEPAGEREIVAETEPSTTVIYRDYSPVYYGNYYYPSYCGPRHGYISGFYGHSHHRSGFGVGLGFGF